MRQLLALLTLSGLMICAAFANSDSLAPSEALPLPDPQFVASMAEPWIVNAAKQFPSLFTILALVGALRMVFKPLFSWLKSRAAETPGKEDDERLNRAEASFLFRLFAWVLDFGASIKLKKPPQNVAIIAATLLPLAFAGCVSSTSDQRDVNVIVNSDGSREERSITSRQTSRGLWDTKATLRGFKAKQTDKNQSTEIGSLETATSATNVAPTFRVLFEGAASGAVKAIVPVP